MGNYVVGSIEFSDGFQFNYQQPNNGVKLLCYLILVWDHGKEPYVHHLHS